FDAPGTLATAVTGVALHDAGADRCPVIEVVQVTLGDVRVARTPEADKTGRGDRPVRRGDRLAREVSRVVKRAGVEERQYPDEGAQAPGQDGSLVGNGREHARRQNRVGRLVVHRGQAELPEVVDASGASSGFSGGLDGREEEGDEQADDRDD